MINIYTLENDYDVLADVVEFQNEKVVVSWRGEINSIIIHDNIENFKKISLNGNRTLTHNITNIHGVKFLIDLLSSNTNKRNIVNFFRSNKVESISDESESDYDCDYKQC